MATKKIRFWTYQNGPVKVTITAGQTLHHSQGGPTDEGWSRTTNIWSFDGDVITHEWIDDGQDCDGRLTTTRVRQCPVCLLRGGRYDAEDGVTYPDWRSISRTQRDYSAEAMGY